MRIRRFISFQTVGYFSPSLAIQVLFGTKPSKWNNMIERQYQLDLWRTLSFFLLLPSATSSSVFLWEEKEGDKILSCHVRSILDGRPPRRAEKNWRLSLFRSFGEGEKRAGRCRNSNYSTINPISIKDRAKSIVHSFAAFYPSLKNETRQKNKKKKKETVSLTDGAGHPPSSTPCQKKKDIAVTWLGPRS